MNRTILDANIKEFLNNLKLEEIKEVVHKFPKIRKKVEDGILNEPKNAEAGLSTA